MLEAARLSPKKVMELGVGFGKIGCLLRETLDAVAGRCRPDQWQTVINGVEGFEQYRNPCWHLYSSVVIADFRKMYEEVRGYGLVLMVDSLEHVKREEANALLDFLVAHNSNVLVSVPLGEYPQGVCHGNVLEAHRSTWTIQDFERFQHRVLHVGVCGVVSIPKQ